MDTWYMSTEDDSYFCPRCNTEHFAADYESGIEICGYCNEEFYLDVS